MQAERPIKILQLGYLGIAATDPEAWRGFAADYLGMQVAEAPERRLAVRMDDRAQRLLIEPAARDGLAFVGFELESAAAVERAAAALQTAGFVGHPSDPETRALRQVAAMLWFQDPDGNRIELFSGPRAAAEPFRPGRPIGGFRTGELGLGHAVIQTRSYEAMRKLYMDVLGFHLSDDIDSPFRASFMHVNPRHHSFAIIEAQEARCHHLMVEYLHMDDIGRLYDMALKVPGRIITTLGRHTNDHMLSFYSKTPGGFMIETGWAGRLIDMPKWKPEKLTAPSLWGHERSWLPPAGRQQAQEQMAALAARGILEPVEVVRSPAFNLRIDQQPSGR